MPTTTWAFIVGEYPPHKGGIADYTWQVAEALSALGDTVHVYAPPALAKDHRGLVQIHRLNGRFDPLSLIALLTQLRRLPKPRRVIVQYVAESFGMRALNFPFALSLLSLRNFPLWVMFHEFAMIDNPQQSIARRGQALGTRWMATLMAQAAKKAFVSTQAWSPFVLKAAARHKNVTCLPVPSNAPTYYAPRPSPAKIRAHLAISSNSLVIGHFGTYVYPQTCESLKAVIPAILQADESRRFLLIGRNGQAFVKALLVLYPSLDPQLIVTGGLTPELLAAHLGVCDVLVQPFGDGVTTRRTSLTAGLALGVPTVSTAGAHTEDFWETSEAVLLARSGDVQGIIGLVEFALLNSAVRARLRDKSRELYERRFDLRHTISALRSEQ